jgi:phosphoribosylamine--glycine ligase
MLLQNLPRKINRVRRHGAEDPIKQRVADALAKITIPAVGPTQSLARLETSKSFTRDLVSKYNIPVNPQFKVFKTMDGGERFFKPTGRPLF